ncbi:glycosyltransferase family 2 protein [Candidatus Woesearchaeota archaeon]|jgi:glycosyltransferase involved in cell wall biosynthesis|nr:glycosyltransferase family 2 protein [Candidatus Woesearchaeota archaeon]MBT4110561.1 glycosyltransferase family 2 protein [Candidatus Woesearchaeota archaeon]MBT4335915.1 glycosyltransferase family 2 protein [Candidatus Woesearchaeota archaeon]MBT4469106.1 glycosyltransferase family 2 protein [Candidatus Woesearchaeota archaeon]MBT6744575.1 glycosyltransferase family 2 protein [Candidatus Woesearchaeota archaeon]
MKIIITIPAYNEEKTLPKVIAEIRQVMEKTDYDYQIMVLNDGSIDQTKRVAEEAGAIVFSNKRNKGLADTFKHEIKRCLELNADIIVHTDADGQYPAIYIPQLIEKLNKGYDLILGSRFGKGNYSGSLMKNIGNKTFAKVFSGLLKVKLTDTTTGFRAFTREVAELPLINNFTYTQEQLIRAGKEKMKIGEVPITTNRTRKSRLFKNPFDYAIKAWINIFRIYRDFEPIRFFGLIGFLSIIFGMLIGVYFVYLHFTSGISGHLGLLFLMLILLVFGVQTILFGFIADMIRK